VQETLFVGTAGATHWPFVHEPEQHCAPVEQLCPLLTHAVAPHFPPEHERSQHSALPAQLSPATLQNCDELHLWVVESQVVEQQSAPLVQSSPPGLHAACTGAAQAPLLHRPEQHSDGSAQPVPRSLHDDPFWLLGCPTGGAPPCFEAGPQPALVKPAYATKSATTQLPQVRMVQWCRGRAVGRKDGT
jgi:hypothetical protein